MTYLSSERKKHCFALDAQLSDHFNHLIHVGGYKKAAILRKQILRWVVEEESRLAASNEVV